MKTVQQASHFRVINDRIAGRCQSFLVLCYTTWLTLWVSNIFTREETRDVSPLDVFLLPSCCSLSTDCLVRSGIWKQDTNQEENKEEYRQKEEYLVRDDLSRFEPKNISITQIQEGNQEEGGSKTREKQPEECFSFFSDILRMLYLCLYFTTLLFILWWSLCIL